MNAMTQWANESVAETCASSLFLGGIVAEVSAGATAGQRRAFFRAVGARIAASHPLVGVSDLTGLTVSVNTLWAEYGCGQVSFALADDGILITHTNLLQNISPILGEETEQTLSPLLEGAYDAWLRSLGSGAALTTRTLWWSNTEARLKHGR
jgi:hypothetical protein